jgi:hypothetical protein
LAWILIHINPEPLAKLLAAGAGKEAIYVGYIKYKSSIIV